MDERLCKRILYATDMSGNAAVAAQYAIRLANDYNAHLTVVNVVADEVEEMSVNMQYDMTTLCDEDCLVTINKDSIAEGRSLLTTRVNTVFADIMASLSNCHVEPKIDIRAGDPVEQIILAAEADNSDLIIVGARGHSMLDELFVGSVARGVVKKSQVPVMTIPLSPKIGIASGS
jgi:nucleotide-binding universal stress UspA family protein